MPQKILKKSTVDTKTKLANMGQWLESKKAKNTVLLDLTGQNTLSEGLIVAGATSMRHAQGLADFILEMCKENNYEFLHMEGYNNGLWILLDFNDVIVNIFQDEERKLYRLEELFPQSAVMANAIATDGTNAG